jgi:GC-rich sequence DNA-binding factor
VWRRVKEFKRLLPKLYVDAYVPLALPRLFAPFVRLQMVDWRPLTARPLETCEWLLLFLEISDADVDANLIPHLVASVVVPKV